MPVNTRADHLAGREPALDRAQRRSRLGAHVAVGLGERAALLLEQRQQQRLGVRIVGSRRARGSRRAASPCRRSPSWIVACVSVSSALISASVSFASARWIARQHRPRRRRSAAPSPRRGASRDRATRACSAAMRRGELAPHAVVDARRRRASSGSGVDRCAGQRRSVAASPLTMQHASRRRSAPRRRAAPAAAAARRGRPRRPARRSPRPSRRSSPSASSRDERRRAAPRAGSRGSASAATTTASSGERRGARRAGIGHGSACERIARQAKRRRRLITRRRRRAGGAATPAATSSRARPSSSRCRR